MKRKYILGALATVLLIAAFLYLYGGGHAPAGQAPLKRINAQNIAEIRDEFNAAKNDARVLLLLSPT